MTPNIMQQIEEIKNIELKSAMDQLYLISGEILLLNNKVSDIYANLQKKVNLQSEQKNGSITVKILGSGTVSVSGINVVGIGTLFKTDCSNGNIINIGLESAVISNIVDDTHLTVDTSLTTASDQIYSIEKNVTQELLTGDFQYGELNGDPYNGTIAQGSTLQHYGRMSNPNDVVNVQFVMKAINPAMAKALNAVQRDGDIVGDDNTEQINYEYRNVNFIFNSLSDVRYSGFKGNPSNLATMFDIVSFIDTYKSQDFYARWENLNPLSADGYRTPLASSVQNSKEQTSNFNTYFEPTLSGLKCKVACKIILTLSAQTTGAEVAGKWLTVNGVIKKNGGVVYADQFFDGYATGVATVHDTFSIGLSAVIPCEPGDILVAGFNAVSGATIQDGTARITISRTGRY